MRSEVFQYLDEVIKYTTRLIESDRFFDLFWYFLIFEFTRYVSLDLVVLLKAKILSRKKKQQKEIARKSLHRNKPLISILVPGKNEGKHIPKLVQSLKKQSYKKYELIIVDDGSDDNTYKICKELENNNLIDVFISHPIRGGKASAANTALKLAKGEFIIHLDADTNMDEKGIENIILPFYLDENVGGVSGDIRVENIDESVITSCQGVEYFKTISIGRTIADELNILKIISGAYGAFRKDILDKIGGWDIGPGLDGDITIKIRKLGFRIAFANDAISYTNVPNNITKLSKQRFRWDRSLIRFRLRKHIDLIDPFNKHFEMINFFSLGDGLLYNFVFNFFWWMYLFQLLFFESPADLSYILLINYMLYLMTNTLEFLIIIAMFGDTFRYRDWKLFLFIPLMPIYQGWYLRLVRTFAHIMELLFKVSYRDSWNPWKVSKKNL
ncbi:MAG: glycosyltransferase [Campylobacterota bacterium]|nr:glycosyltransferase [Campylobacterota bacterium]